MAMSDDTAWFEASRVNIAAQYPGQYVIIKNKAVVGAYPDYQTAYSAGVAILLLVVSCWSFLRLEPRFAESI